MNRYGKHLHYEGSGFRVGRVRMTTPERCSGVFLGKGDQRDLNPRPPGSQPGALTN